MPPLSMTAGGVVGGVMIIAVTALVVISVLVCVMRRCKKEKEAGNDWLCHEAPIYSQGYWLSPIHILYW